MPDELSKRRPDFVEGVLVVLADGQGWQLRRPVVDGLEPADNSAGFRIVASLGNAADNYSDLITARDDAATDRQFFGAEFAMARAILTANYDLDAAEVGSLLKFGYKAGHNPEWIRIHDEVMGVALGNDPKPSGDGDESSLMPGE